MLRDGILLFLQEYVQVEDLLKAATIRKLPMVKAADAKTQLKRKLKSASRALETIRGVLDDEFLR